MDVRMIAHDMRTPLNALSLGLKSAEALAGKPDIQVETFNLMERNLKALSLMVESLLATSEHGPWTRGTLSYRECLPLELVASAVDQVAPLAAAKRQNLESSGVVTTPTLVADGERLVRVLVNLLSNAVKFTPENGSIRVDAKLRSNDGHRVVVFTVSDTGCGVPSDLIDRIFEEGVSVADPGKYSSGLGLTVCRELVEAHGGRIWAEGGRTTGAAFSFSIPRDKSRKN